MAILVDMQWYCVVLIYISKVANDAKKSFHVLFGHLYISSLNKCLFKSFAHLKKIGVFFFFVIVTGFLDILDDRSLSDV